MKSNGNETGYERVCGLRHLRMSSRRSSLLAGLGGGWTAAVAVFGGKAGGFPRGSRGLPGDSKLRGTRRLPEIPPESGDRGVRREALRGGLDCGVGKVGVGGMEEPSRGREVLVKFFREVSEKLRLERLRLRSWSGCSSEPPEKLVVTLCPLVRVTATCEPEPSQFEVPSQLRPMHS